MHDVDVWGLGRNQTAMLALLRTASFAGGRLLAADAKAVRDRAAGRQTPDADLERDPAFRARHQTDAAFRAKVPGCCS
jgi:hypothetical protein